MERELLIEEPIPFDYVITEDANDGVMRISGKFQQADAKNKNGRIYPKRLWETVLGNSLIQEKVRTRCMYGEADHPKTGTTELSRVSHIITNLTMDKRTGIIAGEAEILDTDPNGKNIQELFRKKCRVGISSRGHGSVVKKTGMVAEDYDLDTFDFVVNPSTYEAYPELAKKSPKFESTDPSSLLSEVSSYMAQLKLDMANLNDRELVERASRLTEINVALNQLMEGTEESLRAPITEVEKDLRELKSALDIRLSEYMTVDIAETGSPRGTPVSSLNGGEEEEMTKLEEMKQEIDIIKARIVELGKSGSPESGDEGEGAPKPEAKLEALVTELSETYTKLLEAQGDFVIAEQMMDAIKTKHQMLRESLGDTQLGLEAAKDIIRAQKKELDAGGTGSELSEDLKAAKTLSKHLFERCKDSEALLKDVQQENNSMRGILEGVQGSADKERRERIITEAIPKSDPKRGLLLPFLEGIPTNNIAERVEQLRTLYSPGGGVSHDDLFEDFDLDEDDDVITTEDEEALTAPSKRSLNENKNVMLAREVSKRLGGK